MRSLLKILLLLVFFLLLGLGFFFFRSKKQVELEKSFPSSTPTSGVYGVVNSQVDGKKVFQITGWVLEKEEKPKALILIQSQRTQKIVLADEVKFIKPKDFTDYNNVAFIISSWEEINPGKTKILALCVDPECKKVSQVMITEMK